MELLNNYLSTLDKDLATVFKTVQDYPTGCYFPVWIAAGYDYTVNELEVDVTVADKHYSAEKYMVDVFFAIYDKEKTIDFITLYEMAYDNDMEVKFSFEHYLHKAEHASGQAKILASALDAFVDCDREVHCLVVGSSNKDFVMGGKSYLVLIDMLSNLGYYGSFILFDPLEPKNYSTKIRNFDVTFFAKRYDYTRLDVNITHVLDDSFDFVRDTRAIRKLKINKYEMYEGSHQFVVIQDKGEYQFRTVNEHKDVKEACGGGSYVKDGEEIRIYGTSMRHGPYSPSWFENKRFHIEKPTRASVKDKNKKLNTLYPKARIVLKGLDQTYIGTQVKQKYYEGSEYREYIRVPLPPATTGCDVCHHIRYLSKNIRPYTSVDVESEVTMAYASIMGKMCKKIKYQRKKYLEVAIRSQARVCNEINRAIENIINKTHQPADRVENMMNFLLSNGIIRKEARTIFPMHSFTRRRGKRFYNKEGYYTYSNTSKVYDSKDKEVNNKYYVLSLGKGRGKRLKLEEPKVQDVINALHLIPTPCEYICTEIASEVIQSFRTNDRSKIRCYIGSEYTPSCNYAIMLTENPVINAMYERNFETISRGRLRIWHKL